MKRIFSLIFLIVLGVNAIAQSGTGIITDPYYGDISTSPVWSLGTYSGNTVYVGTVANPDLKIINGGHLTINPGITVIFTQLTSDLLITGSGQLTALGTNSQKIKFTKAPANGHWGHISFETPGLGDPISGTGSFDYCIIEYGYAATSGTTPDNAGGGLQINASGVVVDHCLFENNYSNFGGAVTVNAGRNTIIRNSIFKTNLANEAGGALLLWTSSTARVENCIFEQNHSAGTSYYLYSGGAIWSLENTSIIVNCTFVKNSSSRPGDAIFSYASAGMQIINSILWGSNAQFAGDYTTATIVTCAFETAKPANATNSIIISNIGDDHFVNAGASDWTLKFISPCRDAGTAAGAPSTDIAGKFRIGLPDIGAYEVQYSNWTGAFSTIWTTISNWEASVDPASGSGDVVIPFISGATPNYPAGAPDFTIGTGKTMILRPGAQATMGSLTNSGGTLRLEEDVTGISSLILSSYSGNPADIQLYLPGGGGSGSYKWHYISSPVSSLATSVFTGTTINLTKYDESLITTDQNIGWVGSDGWVYLPTPGHTSGNTFTSLNVGQGYNHYLSSNHTYTISGAFNTGNVIVNLAYNSIASIPDYPFTQGFNLLGNPFPSCLDWSQIAGSLDASISKAIYFNKSGGVASWVGGVGTNTGTATIPPMQGFFVKASVAGKTITLPISARVHSATQIRYKKGLEIIPLVRLKIEDQLNSDDAVVRFDEKATTAVDNDFDAYKFSKTGSSVDIWTTTGGADLSINGLPFPNPGVEIPVSIYSSVAGNIKISGSQIDGLENYSVSLTDNVNNITIDLKKTANLSFNAPGGIIAGRFILKIFTIATAVPETTVSDKPFNVYSSKGTVNIQTLDDIWDGKSGGIKVLDMTGRIVTTEDNVAFSKDDLHQISVRAGSGIYIVEIRSGVMRYVGKVVVR